MKPTFVAEFGGVRALRSTKAKRMLVYGLAELSCEPPVRTFQFQNKHGNQPGFLEVDAETFQCYEEPPAA